MPSPEPDSVDPDARALLLGLARRSIAHGLEHGRPLAVDAADFDGILVQPRATFVTLHEDGDLRGCIGHLEALAPLIRDVADNAFAAAFRDPRFPPLSRGELVRLAIEISVLTPAVPIEFASERELIERLEPGRDGVILAAEGARGTFLPSVWESLPEPRDFLLHLKRKAGLPPGYWSDAVRAWRYRTESFAE